MKKLLLLILLLSDTVAAAVYKPVSVPAKRIRLHLFTNLISQQLCQLACDCARKDPTNCGNFNPPIDAGDCQAYYYRDGGCALLGKEEYSSCSAKNMEYVLVPDPCLGLSCVHGDCIIGEDSTQSCECHIGYSGTDCAVKKDLRFLDGKCVRREQKFMELTKSSFNRAWDDMQAFNAVGFLISYGFYKRIETNSDMEGLTDAGDEEQCQIACNDTPDDICGRGNFGWLFMYPESLQISISGACDLDNCSNQGTCHTFDDAILYCACEAGLQGRDCKDGIGNETNPCDSSPCTNGGLCLRRKGGFSCLCKRGFGGPICDPISDN